MTSIYIYPSGPPGIGRFVAARAYVIVILAWMFADLTPRFFQGDSLSYLATGENWIPPDRSWAFGFMANFMLRYAHGYSALMLTQIGVLACLIAAARTVFSDSGRPRIVYGAVAVLLAFDPLLEIYARFVMSDLMALAAFVATLLWLLLLVRNGRSRDIWLIASLVVLSTVVAVFIRVAYGLIIELTVVMLAIIMCRRLSRWQWLSLGIAALGPFIAVGSLVAANRIVFADRLPHELFVTKLSGLMLASVFAPALQQSDFAAAGIPITPTEVSRLELGNYNKRGAHIWGQSPDDLQQFIRDKLSVKDDYPAAFDKVGFGLVWSALKRNPIDLAKVYLWGALQYANPTEWRGNMDRDFGLSRALPVSFVAFSNRYTYLKIDPDITSVRSPLVQAYETAAYTYPVLLALALAAAAFLMIRHRDKASAAVLTAGLLADLAAAPVYSVYAVSRYVLGAVFVGYVLIGLAIELIVSTKGCGLVSAKQSRQPVAKAAE